MVAAARAQCDEEAVRRQQTEVQLEALEAQLEALEQQHAAAVAELGRWRGAAAQGWESAGREAARRQAATLEMVRERLVGDDATATAHSHATHPAAAPSPHLQQHQQHHFLQQQPHPRRSESSTTLALTRSASAAESAAGAAAAAAAQGAEELRTTRRLLEHLGRTQIEHAVTAQLEQQWCADASQLNVASAQRRLWRESDVAAPLPAPRQLFGSHTPRTATPPTRGLANR